MSATPLRCVVDASVGMKLFVAESLSDKADALFDQLAANPAAELHVPDLFYIECANILWKHVQRYGYAADQARRDLAGLEKLVLHRTATADLMRAALDIALAHGITAYDACYVALAHLLAIPLVTADEPLVRQLAGTRYAIRALKDFSLSPPGG